ncbi:hypothetical protein GCM10009715_23300 [Paeniglutamicibacter psychrophenolicus]|uniref:DNA/RNA non-specific endonuclease n=1 Tax=Paeniglutamicibacter psychrophenolicus TaxID=257454 RepID=A0ABS4WHR8_9MICC|nr:hypothetical protein [Paeniglutamicibacter psychrophenolicus]
MNFTKDPRLPEAAQTGNELYAGNRLDRGHIARRAGRLWGQLPEANQANWDSFYYTNTTPQMDDFNQSSRDGPWGRLEVALHEDIAVDGLRVSVFGGSVVHEDDRIHRGAALPREYWKLVAFTDYGTPKARAFLPTQDLVQLRALPDLDEFRDFQATLAELEARTRNHFPGDLHTAGIPATRTPGDRMPPDTAADIHWQARPDHGRAGTGFQYAWAAGPGTQSEVGRSAALCGSPPTVSRTSRACRSTKPVNSCCAAPKITAHARICGELSNAVSPGMKPPRKSISPTTAVKAPTGSFMTAGATAKPCGVEVSLTRRSADASGNRGGHQANELDQDDVTGIGRTVDDIIDVRTRRPPRRRRQSKRARQSTNLLLEAAIWRFGRRRCGVDAGCRASCPGAGAETRTSHGKRVRLGEYVFAQRTATSGLVNHWSCYGASVQARSSHLPRQTARLRLPGR